MERKLGGTLAEWIFSEKILQASIFFVQILMSPIVKISKLESFPLYGLEQIVNFKGKKIRHVKKL